MMSFLPRVNYSFDDRYTLTGSFRADGSSRFGIDSRWGYFPSVSAGWTLSNEPFLKDALKDVASIRLRASWGKSGNNDIGNYASLAGISSGSYAFGQTPVSTTYEGSFTDAALGWETTRQTNVGIDLGFFNGRLNVIGNWYNSISTDILYKYPISSISGATSTTTNMSGAKIRNRGFDVQLDARLLTGKVNWNFSTNISVNRNKVVSMGGLDDIISTTERSVGSHITKEGKPIGSFYGYQAVGIMSKADYANALLDRDVYIKNGNKFPEGYQLKGPAVASYALDNLSYGNAIWKDANGDGVITTDDKTIIGDAYPDQPVVERTRFQRQLRLFVRRRGHQLPRLLPLQHGGIGQPVFDRRRPLHLGRTAGPQQRAHRVAHLDDQHLAQTLFVLRGGRFVLPLREHHARLHAAQTLDQQAAHHLVPRLRQRRQPLHHYPLPRLQP